MLHACVQRFDVTGTVKKFLELNRALWFVKNPKKCLIQQYIVTKSWIYTRQFAQKVWCPAVGPTCEEARSNQPELLLMQIIVDHINMLEKSVGRWKYS